MVAALRELRQQPVIDKRVFPVRETRARRPGGWISRKVRDLCIEAGLTRQVERDGETVLENRWNLTGIRRKLNTDLGVLDATKKEQLAITGHRSEDANTRHCETVLPSRMRELADRLPAFGIAG